MIENISSVVEMTNEYILENKYIELLELASDIQTDPHRSTGDIIFLGMRVHSTSDVFKRNGKKIIVLVEELFDPYFHQDKNIFEKVKSISYGPLKAQNKLSEKLLESPESWDLFGEIIDEVYRPDPEGLPSANRFTGLVIRARLQLPREVLMTSAEQKGRSAATD